MKKELTIIMLALACLASCQQEEKNKGPKSFTGVIEQETPYLWEKGDQVAVFNKTTAPARYQVEDAAAGQVSGKFNPVEGGESLFEGSETDSFIAYYPYSQATLEVSEDFGYQLKNVNIKPLQEYDPEKTISQNTLPMVSLSADMGESVAFKSACGVLRLQMTGEKVVRSIELKGNNGEKIAGAASISFNGENLPVVTMSEDAATEILLDCGEEGFALDNNKPTVFDIVVAPAVFEKGFTVTIMDENEKKMVKEVEGNAEIVCGDIMQLDPFAFEINEDFQTFTVNGVSFNMIKVKAGTFTMGATPDQGTDARESAKPAHKVTLTRDFLIGETEVTQELYEAVMGTNPSSFVGNPQYPVEMLTWSVIVDEFLPKLNKLTGLNFNLPTEAQWEYAARGGHKSKGYKYSGSNDVNEVAWHRQNSAWTMHNVAQLKPNELGLYDMSGNAQEYVLDFYGAYSAEDQTDPVGPDSGDLHILRGSGFAGPVTTAIVSYRNRNVKEPYFDGGMRLVLVL